MLLLALLLILVGCVVAVTVERTIGIVVALAGIVLLVVALVDVDTADAGFRVAAASWR